MADLQTLCVLKSMILTWYNDNTWKAWICLDPLPFCRRFCLFTHSLFLWRPMDFAMLWSFFASRPLGYLDIAWSQSPVNQMSSDLTDPADKTLHGKRKWQTAGDTRPDYQGSVKRDWSQQLFKLKKAAKNVNILLVPFLTPNLYWLNLIWSSLASACLFIWGRKVPRAYNFSLTINTFFKNKWIFVELFCQCYR